MMIPTMSLKLQEVFVILLQEARASFITFYPDHGTTPEDVARWLVFAKGQVIDRWYRFIDFGISSRRELDGVSLTMLSPASVAESADIAAMTAVSLVGTLLEGR